MDMTLGEFVLEVFYWVIVIMQVLTPIALLGVLLSFTSFARGASGMLVVLCLVISILAGWLVVILSIGAHHGLAWMLAAFFTGPIGLAIGLTHIVVKWSVFSWVAIWCATVAGVLYWRLTKYEKN